MNASTLGARPTVGRPGAIEIPMNRSVQDPISWSSPALAMATKRLEDSSPLWRWGIASALALLMGMLSGCRQVPTRAEQATHSSWVCIRILSVDGHPLEREAWVNFLPLTGKPTRYGNDSESRRDATSRPDRSPFLREGWFTTWLAPGEYMLANLSQISGPITVSLGIRARFEVIEPGHALYLGDMTIAGGGIRLGQDPEAFAEYAKQAGFEPGSIRSTLLKIME